LLAAYSLLYARWFIVSPIDDSSQDLGTFDLGLKILIFSAIVLVLRHIFAQHGTLRKFISITNILSFALTGLYLFSFMPKLEQVASYNGNTYFLTYHREFLDNGSYRPLLAKWDSKLHHTVSGLGETCCTLRLTYDPLMQVVSVVQIEIDTQTLAYTDSNPPRVYESDTQLGLYRYYPSWVCASQQGFICQTYAYTVYRCTLENTGCVQLPFRYSGDYAFHIAMSQDEQTDEINIYFWIGDYPGVHTLIFTYSDNSHCHVAGCKLITKNEVSR
jgi:hypothetical protein